MCRIDTLDESLVKAMAAAGCRKIGFGIEALSSYSLSRIGKSNTNVNGGGIRVLEACDNEGILTKAYLMIGYPWEDRRSLDIFQEDLATLPADKNSHFIFHALPGSPAFEQYRQLLLTEDWSQFNAIHDVVIKRARALCGRVA